ncbi:MAG TPA: YdeI/OmpD-associated family protein [Candidatus Solibacter sp.]|nr:YdeI/OmpD-associated family protein [Candidatus Solibacter sp.]
MPRLGKVVFFPSAVDFRQWLESNGATSKELWVGIYRKASAKPSITYSEALDEALCAGWIDGVRKIAGSDSYTIRFSPRQKKSRWSAVNIKRVQNLADSGRMLESGLKAFEGATEQPRVYSYEQQRSSVFDPEFEREFRANRRAWGFFQSQPAWYRRTSTFWVVSAKKDETRRRRLVTLIAESARGRPIKELARAVPKRKNRKQ